VRAPIPPIIRRLQLAVEQPIDPGRLLNHVDAQRIFGLSEPTKFPASTETLRRLKISTTQKGRTFSAETRAKMSVAARARANRIFSDKHCANLKAAWDRRRGKPISDEARAHMSAAAQRRAKINPSRITPEIRAAATAAKLGKPLSLEHRQKLSAINTGKTISPEHVAALQRGRRSKLLRGSTPTT
jgi:hypothetical protein